MKDGLSVTPWFMMWMLNCMPGQSYLSYFLNDGKFLILSLDLSR